MQHQQPTVAQSHVGLSAEQLLQLQAELLGRKDFHEAATALAQQLTNALKCDRATIGWRKEKGFQVLATSYAADVHSNQEAAGLVTRAMEESAEQGVRLVFPEHNSARPQVLLAHQELAQRQGYAVCTVPLTYDGIIVGALTMERRDREFAQAEAAHIERIATMMAPPLNLKYENELSLWRRIVVAGKNRLSHLPTTSTPSGKLAIAGLSTGLVALALVLLLPTAYRISAPARLEGAVQRTLTAPVDGFLQQVHARPGDHVKAGQVLAELAEQDMQVEQRGLQTELTQYENALMAAQARNDRTEFIVNQGRAEATHAKLTMLSQQLERSQLRAPFDGIVIKGDLSQSIGTPVQRGAELVTLAPDTGYRVMLQMPETDIADIKVGQSGMLMLAALPSQPLAIRVDRITPLATTEEGRHYFPVYATLQSESPALRPGMQGYAKIDVDQRAMLPNWCRNALNWLRIKAWSWGA